MIGRTIGHYVVEEQIGAGGMGEVYRANDSKLGRKVALKILPQAFAGDPLRMGRFEREAQVVASLNHPNIAQIYGIEDYPGTPPTKCLVLELVEGETLAERIGRGPIEVRDVLQIAIQLAKALEYAHERKVIHRDLKPANIKFTADGQVKILDFGLAKAFEGGDAAQDQSLSLSPTLSMAMTQAGMIMGTAGYMSPEQARGRSADKRSDIWSFGVILFEMLAAQQVFQGETISDVLASVLKVDIDWERLPARLPGQLRRLLRRCLQDDPAQRIHDIADARLELESALTNPEYPTTGTAPAVASTVPLWRRLAPWSLALILAVAALSLFIDREGEEVPLRKFTIPLKNPRTSFLNRPVLSPDGKRIAYTSDGSLWMRAWSDLEPVLISDDRAAKSPFWSPDSKILGFTTKDKVLTVSVDGGRPVEICTLPGEIMECTWEPNGQIILSRWRGGIYRVPARGGSPELVWEPAEGEVDFHSPLALPNEKGILGLVHSESDQNFFALLAGRELQRLEFSDDMGMLALSSSGHLVYNDIDSKLWGSELSTSDLTLKGEPVLLADETFGPSLANDGTLSYVRYLGEAGKQKLVWLDLNGTISGEIGEAQFFLGSPKVSPDGSQVVYTASAQSEDRPDVWVIQSDGKNSQRLTFDSERLEDPSWSPGSDEIVVTKVQRSTEFLLLAIPASGGGRPSPLPIQGLEASFSPDGRTLVFRSTDVRGSSDLSYWSVGSESEPVKIVESEHREEGPVVSPNGKFLAYASDESGNFEIYVRPFPQGEGRFQLTFEGGRIPRWSPDGRRLLYWDDGRLMVVEIETSPRLRYDSPRLLVDASSLGIQLSRGFDIHPDGKRIIAVQSTSDSAATHEIVIVQNWLAELSRKGQ